MKKSEIQDYWRWKLVRQVSNLIKDPGEQNTEALLAMIESYPEINQRVNSSGAILPIEPPPANFVCTMDL